jgi:poly-beta-hydroxybutyrate-responsive repressor
MPKWKFKGWCMGYPGGKPPRFLRAFLLLLLVVEGKAHGYELLEKLKEYGLNYDLQDIGYIYRTLRMMEKEGVVVSEWDVAGEGPSRRVYTITEKGRAELEEWTKTLESIKDSLNTFLKIYREVQK